jgi:hypothetical protein
MILKKYAPFLEIKDKKAVTTAICSLRLFTTAMILVSCLAIGAMSLKDNMDHDDLTDRKEQIFEILLLIIQFSRSILEFSIFLSISRYLKVSKE